MKSELIPENGDPPIPITRDITVVGRRASCDVQIDDPTVSKQHAVLVRTQGLIMLRDLATTNGSKVKGQRVRSAALMPGDRLSFGRYKVKVYLGPNDSPSPSELTEPATIPNKFATPTPPVQEMVQARPGAEGSRPKSQEEAVVLNAADAQDDDLPWMPPNPSSSEQPRFMIDLD